LSFDIECLPPEDLTFPQANSNEIITIGMICTSLKKMPQTEHKIIFQLGDTK